MDQENEETNGELQDGVGDDDTGNGDTDDARHLTRIQAIVFRVLRENGAAEDITLDSDLKDDLDLDSLDVVQVVVDLEDELDTEIDVRSLYGIHTVRELIEEVEADSL